MVSVPVTLATAAAAVLVNIWLSWRISRLRRELKVSVGDGGHEPLLRRMRAQANFIESAPLFLILLVGLELSGANRLALAIIAAVFRQDRPRHRDGWRRRPNLAARRHAPDRPCQSRTGRLGAGLGVEVLLRRLGPNR